jgi:tRNA dimethylallyltransferase
VDYLQGRLSLEEALYHAKTRTRQYAKRQMTWFRKEKYILWFNGFGADPQVQLEVESHLSKELRSDFAPTEAQARSKAR